MHFTAAIQVIKNAGAIIVENTNYSAWDEFVADVYADVGNGSIVLGADIVSGISKYLGQLTTNPHNVTSLADITNFTRSFPLENWPERNTAAWNKGCAHCD
jgi:amidase